ncbi:MAG TPA: hypothetical protein VJ654_03295 [Noviherbaspirillum sp.]|nr:hypothetical protein [Noviherbaspirillum sp.]
MEDAAPTNGASAAPPGPSSPAVTTPARATRTVDVLRRRPNLHGLDHIAPPADEPADASTADESAAGSMKPQRHAFQQQLLRDLTRCAEAPDWRALANTLDVSTPRLCAQSLRQLSASLLAVPDGHIAAAITQLVDASGNLPPEKMRHIMSTIGCVLPHLSADGLAVAMNALNLARFRARPPNALHDQLNELHRSTKAIAWRQQVLRFGRKTSDKTMGFIKSFQTSLTLRDDELKGYVRTIATDLFHIPDQEFSFRYDTHLVPVLLFMTNDQRALVMDELADMLRVDQASNNPSAFPALGAHAGIIRLLVDWVTAATSHGNTGLAGPRGKAPIDAAMEKLAKAASAWIADDAKASFAERDMPLAPVDAMAMWASHLDAR